MDTPLPNPKRLRKAAKRLNQAIRILSEEQPITVYELKKIRKQLRRRARIVEAAQ